VIAQTDVGEADRLVAQESDARRVEVDVEEPRHVPEGGLVEAHRHDVALE